MAVRYSIVSKAFVLANFCDFGIFFHKNFLKIILTKGNMGAIKKKSAFLLYFINVCLCLYNFEIVNVL